MQHPFEERIGADGMKEIVKIQEVPVEQIVEKHVPKIVTKTVDRHVPVVHTRYEDKIIHVPKEYIVEKIKEIPEIVEKIVEVPVPRIVEVPKEVIQYVPKVEVKIVQREVQVPGKIIEVPKPVEHIVTKDVYQYKDVEKEVVAAQTVQPHVSQGDRVQKVKLLKYVPYQVPVEVFVPVVVDPEIQQTTTSTEMRRIQLPAGQYNAQLQAANPGTAHEHLKDLLMRNEDGSIPVTAQTSQYSQQSGVGYTQSQIPTTFGQGIGQYGAAGQQSYRQTTQMSQMSGQVQPPFKQISS